VPIVARFLPLPLAFAAALPVCGASLSLPDAMMIARWDFEDPTRPAANTAPAGPGRNHLEVLGPVRFEDGIAKLPAGIPGVALQAESTPELSPQQELTVWARVQLRAKPPGFQSLVDKRSFQPEQRSYALFVTGGGPSHLYGIGGQVSTNGSADRAMTLMGAEAKLPVGHWVQLAMTVAAEDGRLVTEWRFRTEDPDRRNPWTLLGRSEGSGTIFASSVPLLIGNSANLGPLAAELWIDEVRLYERALDVESLRDVWPVLRGYPEVPLRPPGVVIDHQPASGRFYLGSPSIAVLPDGTYVVKCDEYGPAATGRLTRVYRSDNRGSSWERISTIDGSFWSNLFVHQGALYLMGTTAGHSRGQAMIRRSLDGGRSWTEPLDENSGLLVNDLSYHTAPTPLVIHQGRVWRAMEDEKGPGGWGTRFRALMMSAPIDADLLQAANWTLSERLGYNPEWLDGRFRAWLEGNAVVDPEGNLVNILRVDYRPDGGKAAIIRYSPDGMQATFDPERDFIDFPGAVKKFVIRHDAASGLYWALSNPVLPKHQSHITEAAREFIRRREGVSTSSEGADAFSNPERTRNTLALLSSPDLRQWTIREIVLYHPEVNRHGFQYPDFLIEGDDLLIVSRTAYDDDFGGADNQHNANFFTFHRLTDFRSRQWQDGAAAPQ
jgi:hypothetical protein